MLRFTLVTWTMVVLLALAMIFGGPFVGLTLAYITVFTFFMDKITALAAPDAPGQEFPAGDNLSISLGIIHFPLLFGGVFVLSSSATLSLLDKAVLFVALSLFLGQVSNSNAHELIHRAPRFMRRLGVAVYSSVLFGHHASAHVRVHHIHAATDADPNSARLGEHFYAYALRAWAGSFSQGLRAESSLQRKRGLHPYTTYAAGSAASAILAFAIGGFTGLFILLGLAAYAQIQLLLSDYVQHYGLRRALQPNGKPEPVGPQHSWNAPQGFSSALMLNAPRHSDHHAKPAKAYPDLELDRESMPIFPHSLPVMAVLALLPPLWRKIMDKRASKWAAPRAMDPAGIS